MQCKVKTRSSPREERSMEGIKHSGEKKPRISEVFLNMVRLRGFEPLTAWFVARYSIQLSYRRTLCFRYRVQAVSGT